MSSTISNPTLYDGSLLYGSRTIKDLSTSTKVPLMKYTPESTPTAYPVLTASILFRVNTLSPDTIDVFP